MILDPLSAQLKDFADDEIIRVSDFYKPWPHQQDFHECPARFRLAVGSYGSGKSRPLLMEAIFHAMEYKGSNSIILRKTVPDLKRTVIDKFKSDVPKKFYERGSQELGTYNESDHILYMRPEIVADWDHPGKFKQVQSKVYFAACESEKDIGKFLSTEYVFIGFEELGEFPFIIWDALAGRNRCPIPGSVPCMAGVTNPMGIGWGWIKKLWVDHKAAPGMKSDKYDANEYVYFHSTVDQNPIYSKDQKYLNTLESSPMADRIRWGKLDAVSGQYFANWDENRHVRNRDDFIFQDWQPVWVGWDYGFGHYATITFWTKAILKPRWEGAKPKLVNVTVKELYMTQKTVEEQTAALIAAIPQITDDEGKFKGYRWNVDSIHFSWERFIKNQKDQRGQLFSVADQAGDILAAAGLPRPRRSVTDRIAGWTKMYSLLDLDEWFILKGDGSEGSGCPQLAESIPLCVRGNGIETDIEDVVKPKGVSLTDDMADSARYAVAGVLLDPEDKPEEVKEAEELAAIKDPMARSVYAYKKYNQKRAKERDGSKPAPIQPTWMNRVKQ